MPKTDITLQCTECSDTTKRPVFCPNTGQRYSDDQKFNCKCGGDMKEVEHKEAKQPDYCLQVKRYGCIEWKMHCRTSRPVLVKMMFDALVKYKNYGDEVRVLNEYEEVVDTHGL